MKKLLVVFLVLVGMRGMGQVPTWEWARSAVGNMEGTNVALDAQGNVYFIGEFFDSVKFGSYSLYSPSQISANIFLVKYDSLGNVIWARCSTSSGDINSNNINNLAVDFNGNVYITGNFVTSTVTFGSFTLTNFGSYDIFIAKYDSSGNVIWAKGIGGTGDDEGWGITSDVFGNAYLTGYFRSSTISFDSHTLNYVGNTNIFLAKYDSMGNALWAKNSRGTGDDLCTGISSDFLGNIYTVGYFSDSLFFGADTLIGYSASSIFITKYDSSGNVIWSQSAGAMYSFAGGSSIANDLFGNVYITGYFMDSCNFDTISISNYTNNVFLAKYDASGHILWVRNGSSGWNCIGYCVQIDGLGNPYISGGIPQSGSSITFDTITLNFFNNLDPLFIVKYSSLGQVIYAIGLESGGDDQNGIAINNSGNVYVGGDFNEASFIVGSDTLFLSAGTLGETPFVAKLGSNNIETIIPKISSQLTISLFPNPFSTTATVVINGVETLHATSLQIINLLGQEVKTISIINQNQITINRDNLADGMYFYKIIGDKGESVAVGKMLIN